jgi:hypothetical protein
MKNLMPTSQLLTRWVLVPGAGLIFGGCVAIGQSGIDEATQEVSERAQKRWELVMKGQMEGAYAYLSPASRETITLVDFRKRTAAGRWWRKIQLSKVDCRVDTCQVTMILEYDLFEIKGLKASIEETWINDGGTWWLVAAK